MLDENQLLTSSVYRGAILDLIEYIPGRNITQISEDLPVQIRKFLEVAGGTLPKDFVFKPPSGTSRRTVRKHLYELISEGKVDKIGAGYVVRPSQISSHLYDAVTRLLSDSLQKKSFSDWSYPPAFDVASARIFTDPPYSHEAFADFFRASEPEVCRELVLA